tara:strand:- start:11554 stop:12066 length:513 start_codon:yes stop_codon:yes gene_type:complete
MTTPLENLKRNMDYDSINFPVFVVHTDNVELIDGILWIDNQVLDDKNMKGKTLGQRRLQSPMKSLYPLKYMIQDEAEIIKHQGKYYIDNKGYFIEKHKTTRVRLKYHKILRVEKKNIVSMLWLKNCPFPFPLKRPLPENASWAGVLYRQGFPWVLYNLSEEKEKDTWRKI